MPSINDSKCVLLTGATSGIGQALAIAISQLPSKPTVIGTGRRQDRLEELGKSGIEPLFLELKSDFGTLKKVVDDAITKHPDLDTIVLNAGIQHELDLKNGVDMSKVAEEMAVNYTAVVALIDAVLPHFLGLSSQNRPAFIVIVGAGLAIAPAPWIPNYSASKAALHSYTLSLRAQLSDTKVNVIELIPPLVESELHDAYGTSEQLSKFWMPLTQYAELTMEGLRNGDTVISSGMSKNTFERFETGKEEFVMQMYQRFAGKENHQK